MHGEGGPGSLGDEQQQVTPQQEQLIKQGTYVAHVSPPSMHRLNAVKTCTEGTKFDSDRYVACMLKEGEKILKRLLQVHLTVQRLPCRQCGRTLISAEPSCGAWSEARPTLPLTAAARNGHPRATANGPPFASTDATNGVGTMFEESLIH